ncbi:MAG TPA: ABC transporter ATP-binding protein [Planctomycetes bacterium]|nr:ABC transporter ATP-binding protein [Planctomycetota bacterium]
MNTDPTRRDSPAPVVLRAHGIRRAFALGKARSLEILHGIDIALHRGERVALMGASGAGKSTLLHILGLLDRPDEGEIEIDGRDPWACSVAERASIRNQRLGFVFQFYHLLPELTAIENVLLPSMIARGAVDWRRSRGELRARAEHALAEFGLADRMRHKPPQLSGGERQRVAIARALFTDPELLLADEPTGNLDKATGETVLELLLAEQEKRGLSMLLVTHDSRLAAHCERVLTIEDGVIQADSAHPIPL